MAYRQPSFGPTGYQSPNVNQVPSVPPPWIAQWDSQSQRYYFVNQQTGEITWDHIRTHSGGGDRGYGYNAAGAAGYGTQKTGKLAYPAGYDRHPSRTTFDIATPEIESRNSKAGNAAFEGMANDMRKLADNPSERWTDNETQDAERIRAEYRFEGRFDNEDNRVETGIDNAGRNVEDMPDDMASWAGGRVEHVEDVPEGVAGWAGKKMESVEDVPDDVAGWAGRNVEHMEQFRDDTRDTYDSGRDDTYYRDERYGDSNW